MCRYGIGDILVDVMSTTSTAMGFSERWYAEAFSTAERSTLPDGTTIRTIRAPLFLATKLSAWRDRGHGDCYAPDLEDVLAVIDGRAVLVDEVRDSSHDVQRFLAVEFQQLLANQAFLDAVPAHLGGTAIARQRADMALDVIRKIVEIGRR
jgi:predicted nucleotidyltransferase